MKHVTARVALAVGLIIASLSLSGCYDGRLGDGGGHHHPRDGDNRDQRN
jgi:hypothetical protein